MSALAHSYDPEPTARRTRVLIADDHPLLLAGIRRTLERTEDLEIVGEAATGPQVLTMVERRRPDVVLLDMNMPGASGASVIEAISRDWPGVRTIVLSAHEDRATINAALSAGASAYIVKSVNPVDLPAMLRQVAGGVIFHAPSQAASSAAEASDPSVPDLTERERTILAAISGGLTTAAISRELWVSEHTIKFHLTNIYRKLGVSNRAGAVRFALENGLAA